MQMQIQVLSVSINHVPNAKGGYDVAEVAYKDLKDGKVNGKKIMSFVAKNVFDAIKVAQPNSIYDVTIEKETSQKDGKDYWQWKAVTPSSGATPSAPPASGGTTSPRSTYETAEERERKQNYIIRQSSLTNAIAALKTEKNIPTKEEIFTLAEDMVSFVYNKLSVAQQIAKGDSGFGDMQDDVPM